MTTSLYHLFYTLLIPALFLTCTSSNIKQPQSEKAHPNTPNISSKNDELKVGAALINQYLPLLKGKNVGLIVNHTSTIGKTHLVDTLLSLGVSVKKIFAPEHGFRGEAGAGEKILNSKDPKTGLPLLSLYGKKKEPDAEDLKNIDILIFDIQDVGARFYTYISTLHYLMKSLATHQKPLIILDRPNPNGHYVDGPILKKEFQSFIGVDAIPIVHGLTVGEYAQMVNGENWLENGLKANIQIIKCAHYSHKTTRYQLPNGPSPNLTDMKAIYLYPSLCLFEGTVASLGRGTDYPFLVYGHPDFKKGNFTFTPKVNKANPTPVLQDKLCNGFSFTGNKVSDFMNMNRIELKYLLDFYKNFDKKEDFFLKNNFFDKLAGNNTLRQQILEGKSEDEIRQSWQTALNTYKVMRKKYLLYEDFE